MEDYGSMLEIYVGTDSFSVMIWCSSEDLI